MKFLSLFAIAILASAVYSRHHHHHYGIRRLAGEVDAMGVLSELAKNVKIDVTLDANKLFDQIKEVFQNAPGGDAYAVVVNGTGKTVNFEGCPASTIGQKALGCRPHNTGAGKPMMVVKPHGLVTNNQILIKINGLLVQTVQEGYFYTYSHGAFEAKGTTADWRVAMKLPPKILLRRRLQDPVTAMAVLSTLAANVKVDVKLDANQLFDQIKTILQNPPGDPYAVVVNGTGKTVNFEGCPSSVIGKKALGCRPHNTAAGKPNFIVKPHGFVTNNQIIVKINGVKVQTVQEGYFYTYSHGAFEAHGTTADWRRATG